MSGNETKHEKFIRLAENRVNNALKTIDLIGNLSNTNNYDFSEKEASKIIKTLKKSIDELEKKFMYSDKTSFKL